MDQLPSRVREFANYLNGLLARLDQGAGWCAVFWQRDPDGMQACLGGREVPPWDVVEALLQDLATRYGPQAVARETERARFLHEDALAAYDSRPGAREDLGDRLDVTLREQRYATERLAQLGRALDAAHSREAAEALNVDLAWARDDHERATARCAELRSRIGRLEHRAELADRLRSARTTEHGGGGALFRAGGAFSTAEAGAAGAAGGPAASATGAGGGRPDGPAGKASAPAGRSAPGPADPSSANGAVAAPANGPAIPGHLHGPTPDDGATAWTPAVTPEPAPAPALAPVPDPVPAKQRKRRRGSARFAGLAEDEAVPTLVPQAPEASSGPATTGRRTPRGARFAGATEVPVRPEPAVAQPDKEAGQAVAAAVERLVRLRAEGRTGEAHALLAEVAHWGAARFPLLADALQRSGLGADWATLLWETASLPPARLVAAADALTAAGRTDDGRQILRQGVVRPATEIGEAVLALDTEGRHREVRALLDTYVQVRTPEEAAHSAEPDPQRLVPLLLRSAQAISDQRQWDLLHALRVAGLAS
ncbi:hypothetical protein GCM10011578_066120 [Streptomyces fuscichromogenes]|uniref:UL36 very large tegument protein n=1 Tax=Streptomyces fuscichromogenes TaxID=1324013 RepID=A0A918CUH2_9ACTN|nr:hypothetical protein GCM10011578_066120 [Streptomyces fuscichromogenes]